MRVCIRRVIVHQIYYFHGSLTPHRTLQFVDFAFFFLFLEQQNWIFLATFILGDFKIKTIFIFNLKIFWD
jgi:hypothetical protein